MFYFSEGGRKRERVGGGAPAMINVEGAYGMVSVPTKKLKAADLTAKSGNGNGNGQHHDAAPIRPALAGRWSESAVRVLRERYLWKKDGTFLEDEDGMCWRVATAVAQAEKNYGGDVYATAAQFYEVMVSGKYLPNSPTLMNAGKDNGLQLSACFVLPVEDTIEGIFDAVKYAAIIHKSGGGTGFSFSRLRPEGSTVGTSQGVASGPVSFMRIFDAATEQVKQGGTRRGANMGILRVDHPDVEKFIVCKLDGGVTNFNISVAATDVFMQAVKDDTEYDLIEPHTGEVVARRRAREIWEQIVDAAWLSGDPGFVFIDRANNSKSNPTPAMELLEATNPCGEQWLGPYDACNLGSINLAAVTRRVGEEVFLDWEELERVTRVCVRFLDDVIDVNPLPLPQIQEKVRANRRIGLGVMGWSDLLFLLGIPYDSEAALTLGTEIMAKVEQWGWDASRNLATERGPFPNFAQSIYANDAPVRNGTVTTVAPTGSISILADCSSGIEPTFALAYQHRVKQPGGGYRVLTFINPAFKGEMERRGLWNDALEAHVVKTGSVKGAPNVPEDLQAVFVTAQEISPEWHVRQQAAWQKHVDNSISKTVNLPNDATREDVAQSYMSAYDTGCKGITVFRDGCKSEQVLNIGVQAAKPAEAPAAPAPDAAPVAAAPKLSLTMVAPAPVAPLTKKPRPDVVRGYTRRLSAPEGKVYVTVNSDDAGPLEVFATIGRAGSDIEAMADGMGRLISLTLRLPSPLSQSERALAVADELRGIGGSRSVGIGPNQVRSLPDAIGKAITMHFDDNGGSTAPEPSAGVATTTAAAPAARPSGNICPNCGSTAYVFEEGCKKCHACGYSEC